MIIALWTYFIVGAGVAILFRPMIRDAAERMGTPEASVYVALGATVFAWPMVVVLFIGGFYGDDS